MAHPPSPPIIQRTLIGFNNISSASMEYVQFLQSERIPPLKHQTSDCRCWSRYNFM